MIIGAVPACELTGFVLEHAQACLDVAERMSTVILFREPGLSAQSLIKDSYAMKGFRVDTKSCTWGPMRGFVCVDPRLSKAASDGSSYAVKNSVWTAEALQGHIVENFFGKVAPSESAGWQADVMPIVLSRNRIDELVRQEHIHLTHHTGGGGAAYFSGRSTQSFLGSSVTLPWRLVSARAATNSWLRTLGGSPGDDYYVLCVDPGQGFVQELPGAASTILYQGLHTVLGMCNPGSKPLGFKACVTADYDLFAVWPQVDKPKPLFPPLVAPRQKEPTFLHAQAFVAPQLKPTPPQHARITAPSPRRHPAIPIEHTKPFAHVKPFDLATSMHLAMMDIQKHSSRETKDTSMKMLPGNVTRMPSLDDRLQKTGYREHFRFGDVSARILLLKTLLNSAIIGAGYKGGNAIHHNDEQGNMALAKGSLAECLPVMAFVPFPDPRVVAIETIGDFASLVRDARRAGYDTRAKDSWLLEAGLS